MKDYDVTKLSAVAHYICSKSDVSKLGAIKLNKVLWFSDIINFLVTGDSITGEEYVKRQFGPVPKHILYVLESLQHEGKITITETQQYGYAKREYRSVAPPELSALTTPEISLIDDMISRIVDGHSASSISEVTHDDIWEMADIGETIPYEAVMVATLGEIDEEDIAWANRVVYERAAAA